MANVHISNLWRNNNIERIKWADFFQVVPNEYKVFKIVPHLNVSNNQNRDLWYTLHKAFELYHDIHQRSEFSFKTGLKIREKDYVWLDMIFRVKNGKKQVEFYASTTETMSKKFKHMLENKLAVTVEESTLDKIQVPTENVVLHELKYAHHDIFSLNTNHQKQNTPISPILNTLDEMDTEGDFARISMLNERESRTKWSRNALYAYEKTKKGKVPQRANISHQKLRRSSVKMIGGLINEVNSVVQDILNAVQNVVFNGDDNKKEKLIDKKTDLLSEIGTTDIGTKVNHKINTPVWKSHVRVAVHSKEKFNRDNISNTIASAYTELSDQNELVAKKIRFRGRKNEILNELNTLQPSKRTKTDPDVNLISSDEMGKLWQMPTSSLQQKYEDSMSSNRKVETDIPNIFIHKQKKERVKIGDIEISVGSNRIKHKNVPLNVLKAKEYGILIGHSETKGNRIPIAIPLRNPNEFFKGYVFQGQMGVGKDVAIQNFVVEGCLKHNISFIVIDQVNKEGMEGMANGIRDSLPPDKIIDFDLSIEDYLPPLGDLTEVMKKLGRKGADRFANELIQFLEMEGHSTSKKILRNFGKACNGSIYQLQQLLEDESYRKKRIEELRGKGENRVADELDKFTSIYEQTEKGLKRTFDGQKSLDGKSGAILDRLGDLLDDSTLYSVFAQPPKEAMSFEKWMKEGKTIIIRVPDRILSQVAVKTLVHWITLKVLMTRLLMDNEGQENGAFIIYNEPQTYLRGNHGLAELMARIAVQGRKERLGSIFACHHNGQIKDIADDLVSGGVHWFLFKNDIDTTFEMLKSKLEPTFTVETAMKSEKYHAVNILNFGGKEQPAFLVNMIEPPYERYQAYDNSFLTKRHSRMYGRTIDEIEEMIQGA